jgi:hypothetical protein
MMCFIFLGPNIASKRGSESDKGGYRRESDSGFRIENVSGSW